MKFPRFILIAAALLTIAAACSDDDPTLAGPSPTPTPRFAQDAFYRFRLPEGWNKTGTKNDFNERIDMYANDQGDYFNVHIFFDPKTFGRGYSADTTWELRFTADGNRYEIASKDPLCKPSPEGSDCPVGNSKLEIYALVRGGDEQFVRGHAFQFAFGSNRAETGVDASDFDTMIGSFEIN